MLRGAVALGFSAIVLGCIPVPRDVPPLDAGPAQVSEEVEAAVASLLPQVVDEVDPGFGPEVGSLRVLRSIVVRERADDKAAPLGVVAQDMRVLWSRAASGPGCPGPWIEIQPRGWICSKYLAPNPRPPRLLELPRIAEGEVTPGTYGKVLGARTRAFGSVEAARYRRGGRPLADATMVRFKREVRIGGRRYWRTASGELVDARKVLPRDPSRLVGIDLLAPRAPLLPFAWVRDGGATVWEESKRWVEVGTLPARTLVPVAGLSKDGATVRLARGHWVDPAAIQVARLAPPPPEAGPGEKWIDVDLAEQVLVAYEGARPIFATLVSTGTKNPTPTGTWRIWLKLAETQMAGEVNGRSYQVADVPWTMFFHKDFALHGAYWHDRFGEAASSGCVNLAPADARLLYHWTEPEVPLGWTSAYPSDARPGTLVRVRSGPPVPPVGDPVASGAVAAH